MYKDSISLSPTVSLPKSFITEVDFFVGIRKYGKSYGVGVLEEEFMEANYPMIIIDPMGIHFALRERYDNIVICGGPHRDLGITYNHIEQLISGRFNVVFDLSEYPKDYQCTVAANILAAVKSINRLPLKIIIEECDLFIPQRSGDRDCKEIITWLVRKGRQHGIGMTLICQRFVSVDKEVLTQVDNYFVFKISYPNDVQFLKQLVPKEEVAKIKEFTPGDCYLLSSYHTGVMRFKQRKSTHQGITPTLGETPRPLKLLPLNKKIDDQFQPGLRDMMKTFLGL